MMMRYRLTATTKRSSRLQRQRHASVMSILLLLLVVVLCYRWCATPSSRVVTACPYLQQQQPQPQQQQLLQQLRRELQDNNEVLVLLDARFDSSRGGFAYSDNTFGGDNGAYARGTWERGDSDEGGFLQVRLGSRDDRDIANGGMSGGWEREFVVENGGGPVTVQLTVQLELAGSYESDEFAQALCRIDGGLVGGGALLELTGNDDDSDVQISGFETITVNLGAMDEGSHTIAVGGFNNKKTSASEEAFVRFARVTVTQEVVVVPENNDEDDEDVTTEREEDEDNDGAAPPPLDRAAIEQALSDARRDLRNLLNADLIAKIVRLSFHDCLGGMCDGCVNTQIASNRGLDGPIAVLQPVVDEYADVLTRGDVWVLAALVALEASQSERSFEMQWVGRPDCGGDAPNRGPDHRDASFSSHFATAELLDFMAEQFGFGARDTVAIMGAHSLGRAVSENSGFDGRAGWDADLDRLSNDYYGILLDRNNGIISPEFRQELQDNRSNPTFPDQFLWRFGELQLFMLNADLALAVDLGDFVDPDDGLVTCTLSGSSDSGRDVCPAASTLDIALEYASSNRLWINDFHSAFLKMTSVGCNNNVCIEL